MPNDPNVPNGGDDFIDAFLAKKRKEQTPASPSSSSSGRSGGDESVARVLDDEFANLGYNDTARLSILGDIGRENAWNRNTIFGGHSDPKNAAFNRGIISWQGDRRTKLDNYLKEQGVLGKNNDDELRGMARFMDSEMQNAYPQSYNALKNAKSTYDASEALRHYIRYDPSGPYNSYDPNFRVKNNADWAKRARDLGLAQARPDDSSAPRTFEDISAYVLGKPQKQAQDAPTRTFSDIAQDVLGGTTPPPTFANATAAPIVGDGYNNTAPPRQEPVPETAQTINAQMQSALDPQSPRAAVLATTPDQNAAFGNGGSAEWIPVPRREGTLWVNAAKAKKLKLRNASDIDLFLNNNPDAMTRLIGKVENVGDNTPVGQPAVVTRAPDGTELSASAVTSPQAAQAQIQVDQKSFPQGTTTMEDGRQVVEDRLSQLEQVGRASAEGRQWNAPAGASQTSGGQAQTQPVPSGRPAQQRVSNGGDITEADLPIINQVRAEQGLAPVATVAEAQDAAAHFGSGVNTQLNANDFAVQGGDKLADYTSETRIDGGMFSTPQVIGSVGETGDAGIAGQFRPDSGLSPEDAARRAYLAAGSRYGATEANWQAYKNTAKGQAFLTDQKQNPASLIQVSYGALKDGGLDASGARRIEEVQSANDIAQRNAAPGYVYTPEPKSASEVLGEEADKFFGERDSRGNVTPEYKENRDYRNEDSWDGYIEAALNEVRNAQVPSSIAGMAANVPLGREAAARGLGGFASGVSQVLAGLYDTSLGGYIDKAGKKVAGAIVGEENARRAAPPSIANILGKFGNSVERVSPKGAPHDERGVYKFVGDLADMGGKLPVYMVVGAATGGNPILTFAIVDAATAKGKGGTTGEMLASGLKGAAMGAAFGGVSRLANAVTEGIFDGTLKNFLKGKLNIPSVYQAPVEASAAQKAKETAARQIGFMLNTVEHPGTMPSERLAAQKGIERLLKRHNVTLDDVLSGKLTGEAAQNIAETASKENAHLVGRYLTRTGINIGLVSGMGYGIAAAEGDPNPSRNALLFGAMELLGALMHVPKGTRRKFTPEEVAKADGTVLRIPDETGKSRDVVVTASENGKGLEVTDVTGKVPDSAVTSAMGGKPVTENPAPEAPTTTEEAPLETATQPISEPPASVGKKDVLPDAEGAASEPENKVEQIDEPAAAVEPVPDENARKRVGRVEVTPISDATPANAEPPQTAKERVGRVRVTPPSSETTETETAIPVAETKKSESTAIKPHELTPEDYQKAFPPEKDGQTIAAQDGKSYELHQGVGGKWWIREPKTKAVKTFSTRGQLRKFLYGHSSHSQAVDAAIRAGESVDAAILAKYPRLEQKAQKAAGDRIFKFQANEEAAPVFGEIAANGTASVDKARIAQLHTIAEKYHVTPKEVERLVNASDLAFRRRNSKGKQEYEDGSRPPSGKVAVGKSASVQIPGEKTKYGVRYVVREAQDIQSSHDPFTFQPNLDYEHVNNRHYDKSEKLQMDVAEHAKPTAFSASQVVNNAPTAETGAPVIDANGNALGGNSRVMTIKRVYASENAQAANAYKAKIKADAAAYGIDPADIDKFKQPVLVREVTDKGYNPQSAIADLNKVSAHDLSAQEAAIAGGGRLSPETLDKVGGILGEYGSVNEALNARGVDIVHDLIKDGVFTENQATSLLKDNALTESGKDRVRDVLFGSLFADFEQLSYAPANVKNALERVVSPLLQTHADADWDIVSQVQDAVDLLTEREAKAKGTTIDEYAGQQSFVRPEGWSPQVVALAKALDGKDAVNAFKTYAGEYRTAREGSMFGTLTPSEAFKEAFGVEGKAEGETEPAKTTANKPKPSQSSLKEADVPPRSFVERARELWGENWYVSNRPVAKYEKTGSRRVTHAEYKKTEQTWNASPEGRRWQEYRAHRLEQKKGDDGNVALFQIPEGNNNVERLSKAEHSKLVNKLQKAIPNANVLVTPIELMPENAKRQVEAALALLNGQGRTDAGEDIRYVNEERLAGLPVLSQLASAYREAAQANNSTILTEKDFVNSGLDGVESGVELMLLKDVQDALARNAAKKHGSSNDPFQVDVSKAKDEADLNKTFEQKADEIFKTVAEAKAVIPIKSARHEMRTVKNSYPREFRSLVDKSNIPFKEDVDSYTDAEITTLKKPIEDQVLTPERRSVAQKWNDVLQKLSPAERYLALRGIYQYINKNTAAIPVGYIAEPFRRTMDRFREQTNGSVDQFNFASEYARTITDWLTADKDATVEVKADDGLEGTWIKISKASESKSASESISKLQAISQTTPWCTASSGAPKVLKTDDHDFYVFLPKGASKPELGFVPVKKGEEDQIKSNAYYTGVFDLTNPANNAVPPGLLDAVNQLAKKSKDEDVVRTLEAIGYTGLSKAELAELKRAREKAAHDFIENHTADDFRSDADIASLGEIFGYHLTRNGDEINLHELTQGMFAQIPEEIQSEFFKKLGRTVDVVEDGLWLSGSADWRNANLRIGGNAFAYNAAQLTVGSVGERALASGTAQLKAESIGGHARAYNDAQLTVGSVAENASAYDAAQLTVGRVGGYALASGTAQLKAESIGGHARAYNDAQLTVGSVAENASAYDAAQLTVGSVGGYAFAYNNAQLKAESIGGDANAAGAAQLKAESIGGDANAYNEAQLTAGSVGGGALAEVDASIVAGEVKGEIATPDTVTIKDNPLEGTEHAEAMEQMRKELASLRSSTDNAASSPELHQTIQNGLLGATFPDGTIWLNENTLNAETPIHEFGHLWAKIFPKKWAKGMEMLRGSRAGRKLMDGLRDRYGNDEQTLANEALAHAVGQQGKNIFTGSRLQRFRNWLKDLYVNIARKLGIFRTIGERLDFEKRFKTREKGAAEAAESVDADQSVIDAYARGIARELLGGRKLRPEGSAKGEGRQQAGVQFSVNREKAEIPLESLYDTNGEPHYEQIKDVAGRIERGELEIERLDREGERGRIAGGQRAIEASVILAASEGSVQKKSATSGSRVDSHSDIDAVPKSASTFSTKAKAITPEQIQDTAADVQKRLQSAGYDARLSWANTTNTRYVTVFEGAESHPIKIRISDHAEGHLRSNPLNYQGGEDVSNVVRDLKAYKAQAQRQDAEFRAKQAARQEELAARKQRDAEFRAKQKPTILRSVPDRGNAQASPLGFYSRTEKTLLDKMPEKASREQVLGLLNPQKGSGIKEIDPEYQALKLWIDDQKGTLTKTDVLDFVRANKVEVENVVLEDINDKKPAFLNATDEQVFDQYGITSRFARNGDVTFWDENGQIDEENVFEVIDNRDDAERIDRIIRETNSALPAQFNDSRLLLPGAHENYREEFLTAPVEYGKDAYEVRELHDEKLGTYFTVWNTRTNENAGWGFPKRDRASMTTLADSLNQQAVDKPVRLWQDGHSDYSDIKNPIVRVRYDDRETADGSTMLFNEEVQQPLKENLAKMPKVYQKYGEEMGWRRLVYKAVNEGYDYLGFTTGEQQADRYDLSKSIERVTYWKNADGTYGLYAYALKGGEKVVGEQSVPESKLEEYVGKDLAQKIADTAPTDGDKTLSGLGLKIGGQALANRYDKNAVAYLNKFLKPYGGKVEMVDLKGTESNDAAVWTDARIEPELIGDTPTGEYEVFATKRETGEEVSLGVFSSKAEAERIAAEDTGTASRTEVHAVKITPEMRKAFGDGKGVPLFQRRTEEAGRLLTDVLPFEHDFNEFSKGVTGGTYHEDTGELELTPHDSELARRLLNNVHSDIDGTEVNNPSFTGVVLDAGSLRAMGKEALATAADMEKAGYADAQVEAVKALAKNLNAVAAHAKDFGIAYVFDSALPEERVHQDDLRAGRTDAEAVKTLKDNELWNASPRFARDYGSISDQDKASEIAAKLATGQEAEYGWDKLPNFKELRREFLGTWLDGIARRNQKTIDAIGVDAFFDRFERLKGVRNEIKTDNNITEQQADGNGTIEDSGGESGVRGRSRRGESEIQETAGIGGETESNTDDTGRKGQGNTREQREREQREKELEEHFQSPIKEIQTTDPETGEIKTRKVISTAEKYGLTEPNSITGAARYYRVKSPNPELRAAQYHIERIGLDAAFVEALNPPDTLHNAVKGIALQREVEVLLGQMARKFEGTPEGLIYQQKKDKVIAARAELGTEGGRAVQVQDVRQFREDPTYTVEVAEAARRKQGWSEPLTQEQGTKLSETALALAITEEKLQKALELIEAAKTRAENGVDRPRLSNRQHRFIDLLHERAENAKARLQRVGLMSTRGGTTALFSAKGSRDVEIPDIPPNVLDALADIGADILFNGFADTDVISPKAFDEIFSRETNGAYDASLRDIHAVSMARLKEMRASDAYAAAVARATAKHPNASDAEIEEFIAKDKADRKERAQKKREHQKLADEVLRAGEKDEKKAAAKAKRDRKREAAEKEAALTFIEQADELHPNASDEAKKLALAMARKGGGEISVGEAAQILQELNPDLTPDLHGTHAEQTQAVRHLNETVAQAKQIQKDVLAKQKADREAARKELPAQKAEREAAKIARLQARIAFDELFRSLSTPPATKVQKINKLQRMAMVSAVNTAAGNLNSGLATRLMYRLVDMLDLGLQKAANAFGKELTSGGDVTLDTSFVGDLLGGGSGGLGKYLTNTLRPHEVVMKAMVDHPEMYLQLYSGYSSDIDNIINSGKADAALDTAIRLFDWLNGFNRWQEYYVRDLEAVHILNLRLKQHGMTVAEAEGANDFSALTKDDWAAVVQRALEVTYAQKPAPGSKADTILKALESGPGASTATVLTVPFARFAWNAWNMHRQWLPGVAQYRTYKKATRGEVITSRDLAFNLAGLTFLAAAYGLVSMLGDRDDWYYLRSPGTDVYIDMRSQVQFVPFLYLAHKLHRVANGQDMFNRSGMSIATELAEVFLNLNYRQAIDQNSLLEMVNYGSKGEGEKAWIKAREFVGERLGIGFTPLRPIKNVMGSLSKTGDIDLDDAPLTRGLARNVPKILLEQFGFDPRTKLGSGDPKKYSPYEWLKPIGLNIVTGETAEPQMSQTLRTALKLSDRGESYKAPVTAAEKRDRNAKLEIYRLMDKAEGLLDVNSTAADREKAFAPVNAAIEDAIGRGWLDKNDATYLHRLSKMPRVANQTNRLNVTDALTVYKTALNDSLVNEKDKQAVKDVVERKLRQYAGKLTPDQIKKAEKLGLTVSQAPAMPEDVQSELEKFEIELPNVGDSFVLERGSGKKVEMDSTRYVAYRKRVLERTYQMVQRDIQSAFYKKLSPEGQKMRLERLIKAATAAERNVEKGDMIDQ